MNEKRVELLAPAGSLEGFLGVICAGADAVYVGGEKFSARAYAANLDQETLCRCIRYAHLFGRKVYLTLNTLIKETEFPEIYDFVCPLYEAGLDGVIVQDFGVLHYIRKKFPGLLLHASTQMAVTGPAIVPWCRTQGIFRLVPARELSLFELQSIREAGIEVECFVHGAMCYCYSGMCPMSSLLGGRSGNRGRCAQPCRLPYDVQGEDLRSTMPYPLSLKDMCTIDHLPELIEAGMTSFKIEGRMKKSEYAAGVTAIYRKYIDLYYTQTNQDNNLKQDVGTREKHDSGRRFRQIFHVSQEDREILNSLYLRSGPQDGYLFRKNGREMITDKTPGYERVPEDLLEQIREKYLNQKLSLPVSMYARFRMREPASLTLTAQVASKLPTAHAASESPIARTVNKSPATQTVSKSLTLQTSEKILEATVAGPVVQQALKLPSDKTAVERQLSRLGNTCFELKQIETELEGAVFLPNGALNQLRREGCEKLEEKIIDSHFPKLSHRQANSREVQGKASAKVSSTKIPSARVSLEDTQSCRQVIRPNPNLSVLVSTPEQLRACLSHPLSDRFHFLYITEDCLEESFPADRAVLVLPYLVRKKDHAHLMELLSRVKELGIRRLLLRNLEELGLVKGSELKTEFQLTSDASLYCWNREAKELLLQDFDLITLPYELGSRETEALWDERAERIIYGYLPLMQTANCVYLTNGACCRKDGAWREDDSGKEKKTLFSGI